VDNSKLVITMAHMLSFLTLGMSGGILGPTLLDLKQQVDTSLTAVSLVLTSQSVGYVIGSTSMRFLYPKVNFQLASSLSFLISCLMTLMTPFMGTLWKLLLVTVVNHACLGAFETGSFVAIMNVWGDNNGPVIQAVIFMAIIGSLIAPLIAEPFLLTTDNGSEQVKLVYPYGILALVSLIVAAVHYICWITCPGKEVVQSHNEKSNSQILNRQIGRKNWKLIFTVLAMGFSFIFQGMGSTFGSFILTFAVDSDLRLSKSTGAHLTSVFWAAMAAPKLLGLVLVKWIGNEVLIAASLLVTVIANVILVPFGNSSEICLWIGVAVFAASQSCVRASFFSYVGEVFVLTSGMSSALIVSVAFGEMMFPFIISSSIEGYPMIFMWVTLFGTTTSILLLIIMATICHTTLNKPTADAQ
jgi:MFS family permease